VILSPLVFPGWGYGPLSYFLSEEKVFYKIWLQEEGVVRSKRQEEVGAAEVAEAVTEAIAEAIAEAGPEARAEPEMAEPEMAMKNTGNYFYFNQVSMSLWFLLVIEVVGPML
jgi:hypothetical protein